MSSFKTEREEGGVGWDGESENNKSVTLTLSEQFLGRYAIAIFDL